MLRKLVKEVGEWQALSVAAQDHTDSEHDAREHRRPGNSQDLE